MIEDIERGKAKHAVEAAIERKPNVLDVPTVESLHALAEDPDTSL